MRLPVVPEGMNFIKIFFGLSLIFYVLGRSFGVLFIYFSIFFLFLCVFCMFFFRDLPRKITPGEEFLLAPADGVILDIEEVKKGDFFEEEKFRVIKIFMSIFNAHIQRAPMAGKVMFIQYKKGKFIPANRKNADIENEQNLIGIEADVSDRNLENKMADKSSKKVYVLINQIAGIIARRIVCRVKEGDEVKKGEKIGLIKFGSQVDIYVPQIFDVVVKKHDKVKAGITVVAKLKEDKYA
ncbi:phosphatidylserine decarboxylase [bacterium]|nr:phosphatidylserine decarboxylase [bacterium]